jgi:tetratricopeptide (TPR) repeat protein
VTRLDACHVLLCRGHFRDAIPYLEESLAALQAAGLPIGSSAAMGMLAYARAMTGRAAEGIALLCEAIDQLAQGRRTVEVLFMTYLGEAHLLAGRFGEASAVTEQALAMSRDRFEHATEARALYLLGDIAAQGAEVETADRHYSAALRLAGQLNLRPLVAHCHLGLGKLRARTDRHEKLENTSGSLRPYTVTWV